MLQSPHLKYHIKTTDIYQSVRNGAYFEHKCWNNIKKIHQHDGMCDHQPKFKYILEAAMVSTPGEINDDSPNFPMTQTTVNKQSSGKSLRLLTNIFDVKKRTAISRVLTAKSKTHSH